MITLEHYLTVAAVLFVIGIFGLFLNRKNIIILLMSIELMLLSVNINLVAFSSFLNDLTWFLYLVLNWSPVRPIYDSVMSVLFVLLYVTDA